MRKRLKSVYIIIILVCSICSCARTDEDTPDAETEPIADTTEREGQTTDSLVLQEESEQEKEVDYDGSYIYHSILEEYERAWEDETYTAEEWQDIAGVFMTLTDAKWMGWRAKDYTLYYSMSDLTGDGTKELIIGIQNKDEIAPCFLYTGDGARIHMTESRTGSDLVNLPTILYKNGIVESTEYIKYGMYRYNFYQISEDVGEMTLIDRYFYLEDLENGTQYYKGDMENNITEEEFWDGINDYESMPQIELNWDELDGFWESDEDDAKADITKEEYSQNKKEEEPEDKAKSTEDETAASKEEEEESKKDEPVTILANKTHYFTDESLNFGYEYEYDSSGNQVKEISYDAAGSVDGWSERVYDGAGNQVKWIFYHADGGIYAWREYEYDSLGNRMKETSHDADGSIVSWEECGYDSVGNKRRDISYDTDGSVDDWYEYVYDSLGNHVKDISYDAAGSIHYWYEYEYDGIGNQTKIIGYSSDGDIEFWIEYGYDSAGNLIKRAQYNAGRNNYDIRAEWEYDNTGKQTRFLSYDVDGNVVDCYEYEYDSEGNLMQEINKSNNNSTYFRTEYEYDSEGNLTKAIEYNLSHRIEYEYITITPQ